MKTAVPILLILLTCSMGCSGIRLKKYDGPPADDKELALVYIRNNEGSETNIFSVDGEEADPAFKSILELKPGVHILEATNVTYPQKKPGFMGLLVKSPVGLRYYAVYSMRVELKAGFSYVPVPREPGALLEPTRELCLTEEPHEAPAARTNFSGEFRTPGPDAPRVGCVAPIPRPPGWVDRHPEVLRRTD